MSELIKKVYCLTPVYNDWDSLKILLDHIELIQHSLPQHIALSLVAIDDGSTEESDLDIHAFNMPIKIVNLKVNIGHQRAIAVGLQYINKEINDCDYILVLDGDGEDKPEDIPTLIEKCLSHQSDKIIFAQRQKRQESLLFKTGYFFYKYLFCFLTGQEINFGNFSIIPKRLLGKVVHQNNIWNHYSGSIIQSKIPFDKVLLDRGKRYRGASKMNFNNLIIHGLSSIAVYFDYLSIRILRLSLYGIAICMLSVFFVLGKKAFTDDVVPGWASSLILIISGIILQLFSVTLIVLLLQLSTRKNIVAPNANIYIDFIENIESN